MDNDKQKRINRCNRKRGSRFEKVGADFLDMDVVPYSGSNARFGYGDVRDSIWLGEFKNITPKDNKVVIQNKWIVTNRERALDANKLPFLAWMPYGKPNRYIILEEDIFNRFNITSDIIVEIAKKSCKAVNMIFNLNTDLWIKQLKPSAGIVQIKFDNNILYMMSMELFKYLIISNGLKGDRTIY